MNAENKINGKTFWDFMSEHIKIVLLLFIIVIIVLLLLVFNNRTIKIAGVEIAKEKPIVENKTEPIVPEPTIVKTSNKLKIQTEQIPNKKFENNKIQPNNTNSGINNGIIGNNNTVNLNEKPLIFSESDKIRLIELINIEIVKTDSTCIIVSGLMNNNRSMKMADIIYAFLKSKGYNLKEGRFSALLEPKEGISISTSNNCITIQVFTV